MKTYIPRALYMKKIQPFIDKNLIKVLIGQRRVGKSYILFQIMDFLEKEKKISPNQILYINKEREEFSFIKDEKDLLQYIKSKKEDHKKLYVFIDEIQDISGFEIALRDLQSLEEYDLYITGSNAFLLSSEIATYLTGRYLEFEIYPLTYPEFLSFHHLEKGKDSFFQYAKF